MTALRTWWAARFDNPVLRRETRMITRRGHFEWVIFVIIVGMALVIASVGGGAAAQPASVGKVLFQTFFGVAQALVWLAGPSVAASSIASEREGRTYEALVLTGLGPVQIARGKFFAAITRVGSYVIALAPVGALPFLFGGVSALSVATAFLMLFGITALAALLGLAISAHLPTTRSALIVSAIAGACLAAFQHWILGEALGTRVCAEMHFTRPGIVWWPSLLVEGALSFGQMAMLVLVPAALAGLAGWFLFEVCASNLTDPTSDRASGLKRWYAATALAIVTTAIVLVAQTNAPETATRASVVGLAVLFLFAAFGAFVFLGDALVAPRRVRKLWEQQGAGRLRRFFGPGLKSTVSMQIATTALGVVGLGGARFIAGTANDEIPSILILEIITSAMPTTMFILFAVGLAAWLRSRWSPAIARVVLTVVMVFVLAAPYAITAILADPRATTDSSIPLLAAISPLYFIDVARHAAADQLPSSEAVALLLSAGAYTALGLLALVAGVLRSDRLIAAADADAARVDDLVAREDAGSTPSPMRTTRTPPPASQTAPTALASGGTDVGIDPTKSALDLPLEPLKFVPRDAHPPPPVAVRAPAITPVAETPAVARALESPKTPIGGSGLFPPGWVPSQRPSTVDSGPKIEAASPPVIVTTTPVTLEGAATDPGAPAEASGPDFVGRPTPVMGTGEGTASMVPARKPEGE